MGPPPKESPNIVFLGFFWVSRVFFYLFFIFSMGPPPKESPNIFLFFFFLEVFFLVFSMGPLSKESPFEPDNEVKQTMLTKI